MLGMGGWLSINLVNVGRGANIYIYIHILNKKTVKWGFQPLNHNKQKCKMFPNNNHDLTFSHVNRCEHEIGEQAIALVPKEWVRIYFGNFFRFVLGFFFVFRPGQQNVVFYSIFSRN